MKDKILDSIIKFDNLLGITAVSIALVAAFFSVYGIATLFAGAFILTAIMASSLEIGKLVVVTFLYRYWKKTNRFLKSYLMIASVVLMLVTSLGIFGYLSAAYQKSSTEYKQAQSKIEMVDGQKMYLSDKIAESKVRIQNLSEMRKIQEGRLSEGLTNVFLSRNPIQLKQLQQQTIEMVNTAESDIKLEQDKIQQTSDQIEQINQKVNDMKMEAGNKKDIKTFQFVADQFGTSLDNVAKWFIFTIIFVFDPLAVALILAYNVATYKEKKELTNTDNSEKSTIVNPPFIPEIPKKELILNAEHSTINNIENRPQPRPSWL